MYTTARKNMLWIVAVTLIALAVAALACTSTPTPTAAPAQPTEAPTTQATATSAPTSPPTVVPNTPVLPSATPTITATSTITPTPRAQAPTATKPAAPGPKLTFTAEEIEYSAVKRKGDNKVQLTITLHPNGGVPPFYFILDPGTVQTRVSGLSFTFDWHNCGQSEPHSLMLYSADGQKVGPVGFMFPYDCN